MEQRTLTFEAGKNMVLIDGQVYLMGDKKIPDSYPQVVVEKLTTGLYHLFQIDNDNDIDKENQWNILRTTNPNLQGVKQLPREWFVGEVEIEIPSSLTVTEDFEQIVDIKW